MVSGMPKDLISQTEKRSTLLTCEQSRKRSLFATNHYLPIATQMKEV